MRHVPVLPSIILAIALAGTPGLSSRDAQEQSRQSAVTAITGATVIDGRGRTVMPGLVDLHTHLHGGWDGESLPVEVRADERRRHVDDR